MFPANAARDIYFHGSSVHHVGRDQYNNTTHVYMTEEKALAALKPVIRSECDVPRCMEKTRESVFREIDSWLDAPVSDTSTNIMWISGGPGAGKSAIASSLVSNLTKRERLGSFFFFKRGDANMGDPAVLWRTVAYDLAQFYPCVRVDVIRFLSRPGFRDSDIQLHFECLVEDVLKKYHDQLSTAPPVIVMDALDECGTDECHFVQRRILLETITRWACLPLSFKLIVTSRDERLPNSFHNPRLCRKVTLKTGISVCHETQNDIRIFFEKSFEEIRPTFGLSSMWPGRPVIDQLTKRAAGLFIWAKTAIAFVEEKWGDPTAKLKLVLAGDLGKQNENIDALYQQILDFSFKDADDAVLELFCAIVGAIIVAKGPLHSEDLKYFLQRQNNSEDVRFNAIMYSLSSVIELDGILRLRHLSFAEFLTDPNRCRQKHFVIDPSKHHLNLTLACLRVMNTELRFNICRLESSHVRNDDVHDLSERITAFIPTRLSYACRRWAAHLCETATDAKDVGLLLNEVRDFLFVRLLYWLEVMSLLKATPSSSIALLIAARWIRDFDPGLSDFARDAHRFVANYRTPISESAPHIYLSALPFSPSKSLVSKQYLAQYPNTLSIVSGQDECWPALANVLTGHTDWVLTVAFSPDGKRAVSGSHDMTVCVWDIETGQIVAGPFVGHTDRVQSVAYSPDGKQVVSGSFDRTLRLWDVESCQIVADPFEGHTAEVMSVVYSPDGKRVASGSGDGTLRIWDVDTGHITTFPFVGHTKGVIAIAYSPNGQRIVSGSDDRTVRVWDIDTGQVVAGPFQHAGAIMAVAYSPDGRLVISGSDDGVLSTWDITSPNTKRSTTFPTALFLSIAFLPNGKGVVSGSKDNMVYIWDVESRETIAGPFQGHTCEALSVAYSPDGKRIISASIDKTLRVWDVETFQGVTRPWEGDTRRIRPVAFSPDGTKIVSGSDGNTVCVWDIKTGQIAASPSMGHRDCVRSVAYSPDGKQIASGSDDSTIRVWDAETGQVAMPPFVHHDDLVRSILYSPDGKQIVSGSYDRRIRVWDVETSQIVPRLFEGHTGAVLSVAYSPEMKCVAAGSSDGTLCIWDINTGQMKAGPFACHTDSVLSVAYSQDGKSIISASADGTICKWDLASDRMSVSRLSEGHSQRVQSVAHSPGRTHIVSGSADKTICVWDIATGKKAAGPFRAHVDGVRSVAYSPDGKRIVSSSTDKTVYVWDLETSPTTISLDCRADSISSIAANKPYRKRVKLNSSKVAHLSENETDRTVSISSYPHLSVLLPIGGPNVFGSCRHQQADGWTSFESPPGGRSILFWVPIHARLGLCDAMTLFVLGVPRIQLELSRFVHGASWIRCRQ